MTENEDDFFENSDENDIEELEKEFDESRQYVDDEQIYHEVEILDEMEQQRKAESEERERIEKEEREFEEKLLLQKITSEKIEESKQKAEKTQKYYAFDVWNKQFMKTSFCNEIPSQIIFHCILGQCCAPLKIHQSSGQWLDWREHMIWIQTTGSGKTVANRFMTDIVKRLKCIDSVTNPMLRSIKNYKTGQVTSAALLDSWQINNKKKYDTSLPPNQGLLSESDIMFWDEGRLLFEGGNHNEETKDILLSVTEPYGSISNGYSKKLVGYPIPIITKTRTTIIATTRPLMSVDENLLWNGLLQRCLTYTRLLSDEEHMEMINKMSMNAISENNIENVNKIYDEIAEEIMKVVLFTQKNNICFNPENKNNLIRYLNDRLVEINEDLNETNNEKLKEVLSGFISRYKDHLLKLSHHAAAMRFSKFVEEQDIEYAYQLVFKCYENLKLWVDIKVREDRENKEDRMRYISFISNVIKQSNGIALQKDIVTKLMNQFNKSSSGSYYIINNLCSGKKSLFIKKKGKDKEIFIIHRNA